MRFVIDTNIMVSILPSKSNYRWIYELFLKEKYEIALSNEILFEYNEIFERKFGQEASNIFISSFFYLSNVKFYNIYYKWNLINDDQTDNKFVDCYIASSSDYLVTEDNHFNHLKKLEFPKLNIIGIKEFADLLKSFYSL